MERKCEREKNLRGEREKAEKKKTTFKIDNTQKKISNYLKKLPDIERRKFESEEEKRRRQRVKQIKSKR